MPAKPFKQIQLHPEQPDCCNECPLLGLIPEAEREFDPSEFVRDRCLHEKFRVTVDPERFEAAQEGVTWKVDDCPALTFLDAGDTLVIECGEASKNFRVRDMTRRRDLTREQEMEIYMSAMSFDDSEEKRKAEEMYENAKWVLDIELAPMPKRKKKTVTGE